MKTVIIYTDGSSRGNPGKGGFGAVLMYGVHRKEISQGYQLTTNNRMELMAVIAALDILKQDGLTIDIYTDSKYVCEAVEKRWVFGWEQKQFKDKKNPDLWQRFLVLYRKHHIKFHWVKGHAGHKENERCDVLATRCADNGPWLSDKGYEMSL
jgi:ribonuclease HI